MDEPPAPTGEDVSFEEWELERSVPERFERIAAAYPRHLALKTASGLMLTYAELNAAANRLAHRIRAIRGSGAGRAALLVDHEGPQAVAMISILKAGMAIVPLDPEQPPARSEFILTDAQAELILADGVNLARARALAQDGRQVIEVDLQDRAFPAENPAPPLPPDTIGTIYYTSGSTGEPKGAPNNHRTLLHTLWAAGRSFGMRPGQRLIHLGYATYNFSFASAICCLLYGGTLMPFHVQRRGFAQLAQWLSEEGITVYASVSSLFRQFAATLRPAANFPQIRLAVLSGERVLRHDAELLRRHFSPECALLNQFGGTEMRYVADYLVTAETQFPGNIIPAGRIVEGKEVVLLDEKGRPVAPGEIGQITVRSRYLAEGYWRRPELTEAVFKPDPEGGAKRVYYSGDLGYLLPDGALVHLGRKDDMIKIKGRRIELGEVEYALHLLEGVREAAVVARQNPQGREVLVAYLVLLDPDRSPGSEGWRAALARTLPEYMLPAQFVVLSSLPLNPNGKVNRKALPDPDWKTRGRGADFLLPRNEIEERLAGIFQRVLGLSGVGVRDDFFTLGGDSLAYLSLIVEIEKEFAVSLPDQALAGAATVERMEAILDRREEEGLETPDRLRFGSEEAWAKRLAWLIRPLVALLSYERTVRWLCAIVSRQRGRWGMQGSQARLFRRFLAALGSDPPAISDPVRPDESVRRHLAGNLGHRYLCIALARTGPAGLARLVSIEGAEWFHEARRQGRGVILVSGHLNAGRLPILMLHQWGLDDLVAVGKWSADLIMMGLESISRNSLSGTDVSDSVLASQLLRGRRVLARGGVVEILGDGLSGDSREIILPFLGRLRPFKTGFAELALSTGAPVLPVAVSWRLNGEATVRFLPPLAAFGDIRQARVESLVQRLAGFLEEQWRGNPANVYWREIEYFLKLPQAGPGRAPAEGMAPPS